MGDGLVGDDSFTLDIDLDENPTYSGSYTDQLNFTIAEDKETFIN